MPPPARYEEEERFPLFGQSLTLHLLKGTKNSAAQDGTALTLTVTNPDDFELKKRTLEKYADQRCKEAVTEICETVYPLFGRTRRPLSRTSVSQDDIPLGKLPPESGDSHLQQKARRLSHSLHRIRGHARIYAFSPFRPFGALLGGTHVLHAGLESAQAGT